MSNNNRKADNAQRKATRQETIERHSHMRLVVRELKIHATSDSKRYWLRRLFTEGRWCYNWYLQQYNDGKKISQIKDSDEFAIVLAPGGYEMRRLVAASSQMRQEIKKQLGTNLKSLFSNIREGNVTHGTLRYKQACSEIPLKAGKWMTDESAKSKAVTFTLNDKRTRVHLQGCPFLLKLTGGKQIPCEAELADGKLVCRGGDYFLQVTFFVEHEKNAAERENDFLSALDALDGVGLDFGIETHVTASDGSKNNWWFEPSDRLKDAQVANEAYRAWHKKEYGWARSSNAQLRIMNEEYEKARCRKKDAICKFVHGLESCGGFVAVQEEQIKAWHVDERYSDVIQHSVMGGIMARLSKKSSTLVVSKWVRTTGVCPDCGHALEEKPSLNQREWDCPECGARHDRDVAAARVVKLLGVVGVLYPDCPSGLECGVWEALLSVLQLGSPVDCLERVG